MEYKKIFIFQFNIKIIITTIFHRYILNKKYKNGKYVK
jgi:hypothetical protein